MDTNENISINVSMRVLCEADLTEPASFKSCLVENLVELQVVQSYTSLSSCSCRNTAEHHGGLVRLTVIAIQRWWTAAAAERVEPTRQC